MNIGGLGSINDKLNTSTIENVRDKAVTDSFEERLNSAVERRDEKELKKACKEFEGMLLNILYKEMKATVPRTELFEKDAGRDIYQSMLDDKLMEEASKNTGFGLAEALYKQLGRQLNISDKTDNEEKSESAGKLSDK